MVSEWYWDINIQIWHVRTGRGPLLSLCAITAWQKQTACRKASLHQSRSVSIVRISGCMPFSQIYSNCKESASVWGSSVFSYWWLQGRKLICILGKHRCATVVCDHKWKFIDKCRGHDQLEQSCSWCLLSARSCWYFSEKRIKRNGGNKQN